jgi:hypothetical protein
VILDIACACDLCLRWQAFGHLGHHRDPQRDMKPISHMRGIGMQIHRELPNGVAAIGEKGELLI